MTEIVTSNKYAVPPSSESIGVSGCDCCLKLFVQLCFVIDLEVGDDLHDFSFILSEYSAPGRVTSGWCGGSATPVNWMVMCSAGLFDSAEGALHWRWRPALKPNMSESKVARCHAANSLEAAGYLTLQTLAACGQDTIWDCG